MKNVVSLRTICLASLLLTGCLSTQHISHLYVIDTDNGVCSKRKITNQKTLASRWEADLPLEACDGNVSVTARDFQILRGK